MKAKFLFTFIISICAFIELLAQHQALVGTWIQENKQEGFKEMKIISPTQRSPPAFSYS